MRPVMFAVSEHSSGCVMISPGGYRVEGLSADEAVRMLAMLA